MTPPGKVAGIIRLLATLLVVLTVGVLSRLFPLGILLYDKSLGDALYAVAVYLALALALHRLRPAFVAPAALAVCLAVECFKLTGLPERYAHLTVVRWLLGTAFSWHNLACYAVGVLGVALLDGVLLRPGWGRR